VRKKINPKLIKDIGNTIPGGITGIGVMTKYVNNWDAIESFAKNHAVYTAMDVRNLIAENSPIKKIGFANLELVRIVDEEIKKSKVAFHTAALTHFRELCVLAGIDPNKVHMGANWMQLQKKKDKRLQQKSFADKMYPKNYTKVIDNLKARYNRVLENNPNAYMEWCIQNKKNRQVISEVKEMLKYLDKKNKQK
tara:strand:- start:211 stop:792 length:582 start_codon:yes stop_codon:yes gene_type:complete